MEDRMSTCLQITVCYYSQLACPSFCIIDSWQTFSCGQEGPNQEMIQTDPTGVRLREVCNVYMSVGLCNVYTCLLTCLLVQVAALCVSIASWHDYPFACMSVSRHGDILLRSRGPNRDMIQSDQTVITLIGVCMSICLQVCVYLLVFMPAGLGSCPVCQYSRLACLSILCMSVSRHGEVLWWPRGAKPRDYTV